jgi:hypothetical protein
MANRAQKLDRFDALVSEADHGSPWQPNGEYVPDIGLLTGLLGVAVGATQQSGIVAAAADVWVAEELRRAGFDENDVWPRRTQPRVLPRDLRNFIDGGALPKKLATEVRERYVHQKARKALPAEAHVLGAAYSKQADVVIASWATGVELLVSTKTMLSSYQKNLRNRFEEGYGDAKNLRGRHPLAVLGFLYVVGADIPRQSLDFAVDMLRKLVREPDVYDCACLLVLEGAQGVSDDEVEERGPEEDPALVPIEEAQLGPDEDAEPEVVGVGSGEEQRVEPTLQLDWVPVDLTPARFFETLIREALERMPVAMYPKVRERVPKPGSAQV